MSTTTRIMLRSFYDAIELSEALVALTNYANEIDPGNLFRPLVINKGWSPEANCGNAILAHVKVDGSDWFEIHLESISQ